MKRQHQRGREERARDFFSEDVFHDEEKVTTRKHLCFLFTLRWKYNLFSSYSAFVNFLIYLGAD